MPNLGSAIQFKAGTLSGFNKITTKDANTVYFITDKGRIFVGDKEYSRPLLSGAGAPGASVSVDNPVDTLYWDTTNHILYLTVSGDAWVPVLNTTTVSNLESAVSTLQTDVQTAQSTADGAKSAADAAQADATRALTNAATAKSAADAAQKDATQALADAAAAKTQADKGVSDAAAAKSAADAAQADATAAGSKAATNESNINSLDGRLDTAESEIDTLQSQILGLTGAMHLVGIGASLPAVDASKDGDVYIINSGDDSGKEYVFSDGAWHEFGDVSDYLTTASAAATYETKTDASQKLTDAKAYTDQEVGAAKTAAATDAQNKADAALASAKSYADTAASNAVTNAAGNYDPKGTAKTLVDNLDFADTQATGSGSFVTVVTQTDGKVAVTKKAIAAADVPSLDASKTSSGTFDVARIPDITLAKVSDAGAAAAKGVVTSIDESASLPTSAAVKDYVDSAALTWGSF